MTILEGRVAQENWHLLEQAYREARNDKEEGLVQSFLIQNSRDTDLWRIQTVWKSREALDKMRSSGGTPRGVLIFREAQSEPQLAIFEVKEQINWG